MTRRQLVAAIAGIIFFVLAIYLHYAVWVAEIGQS